MRIARVQSPSHSFSEGNSEFVIRSFELSLFLRLKDCASRNATREGTAICGEKVQKKGIQYTVYNWPIFGTLSTPRFLLNIQEIARSWSLWHMEHRVTTTPKVWETRAGHKEIYFEELFWSCPCQCCSSFLLLVIRQSYFGSRSLPPALGRAPAPLLLTGRLVRVSVGWAGCDLFDLGRMHWIQAFSPGQLRLHIPHIFT